jgi:DnaJ-class molecular chaperone
VTIEVQPHRFFTRDGDDIRIDLPITLAEAVKGGPVKVPTVDKPVMLTIPKGASSGRTLRLKGKGFTKKGAKSDGSSSVPRGDQLVTLMVQIPADDAALERFVDGWAGAGGNPRAAMGV